jgi:uncharacterized protein (DUF1778 family)
MSEKTEPRSSPAGNAFAVRVEISPEDLELIDQAAAIEGINREAYLRRAAAIGIRDSLRGAAVLVGFSEVDSGPA